MDEEAFFLIEALAPCIFSKNCGYNRYGVTRLRNEEWQMVIRMVRKEYEFLLPRKEEDVIDSLKARPWYEAVFVVQSGVIEASMISDIEEFFASVCDKGGRKWADFEFVYIMGV